MYMYAVILDPRFKAKYLQEKKFDQLYGNIVKKTIQKMKTDIDKYAEDHQAQPVREEIDKSDTGIAESESSNDLLKRMFSHSSSSVPIHEVDDYLNLQVEAWAVDPLQWWKSHASQFPLLSKLATEVLSIPGVSVAVERLFNVGRDVIGIRRHSLGSGSVSSLMFANHRLRQ